VGLRSTVSSPRWVWETETKPQSRLGCTKALSTLAAIVAAKPPNSSTFPATILPVWSVRHQCGQGIIAEFGSFAATIAASVDRAFDAG